MKKDEPSVVIIAGPNGAGKTTAAPLLLHAALGVTEFVNADAIAQGLSGFAPERVAVAAGRAMLTRIHELSAKRASFAFETTLASRSFAPWINRLMHQQGYEFHLFFLWLPSAELAIERVRDRVLLGGHNVPAETIRRRYTRGLSNFFSIYQPLATIWRMYDNSRWIRPRPIARGNGRVEHRVNNRRLWRQIKQGIGNES
jgi:predicted ABC-type ATPase